MKRLHLLAVVAILLIVSVLGIWLYYETRPVELSRSEVAFLPEGAMAEIDGGANFTEVKDDKISWRLSAKTIRYYNKEERISFVEPEAVIYQPEGGGVLIRGDSGDYFRSSGEVEIRGSVSASSDQGYSLKTDEVHYSDNTKLLSADSEVFIEGRGLKITGKGLVFDVDKQRFSFSEGVRIEAESEAWNKEE